MIKIPKEDGKIDLGFPFYGWLWKVGNYVYVSFIESLNPNKGNLSKLFDDIIKQGYGIKVPTPFARMEFICKKKGFKHTWEEDENFGNCEVWVKEVN